MSKRILICEDEEGIRESLKLVLSDYYDLILTKDGIQCPFILDKAKDIKLVLLGVKMPKNNSLDILKQLKEKHPDIEVIIITSPQLADVALEAVRLGASGSIIKPFKSSEILATVRSILH